VYAALRRRRLLEKVTPHASPREIALATIVKLQGVGLGQIEAVLKGGEKTWLAALKGQDLDDQPFEVRADLPDWVIERCDRQWTTRRCSPSRAACSRRRRSTCASTR
jgi:hypothetical protein